MTFIFICVKMYTHTQKLRAKHELSVLAFHPNHTSPIMKIKHHNLIDLSFLDRLGFGFSPFMLWSSYSSFFSPFWIQLSVPNPMSACAALRSFKTLNSRLTKIDAGFYRALYVLIIWLNKERMGSLHCVVKQDSDPTPYVALQGTSC